MQKRLGFKRDPEESEEPEQERRLKKTSFSEGWGSERITRECYIPETDKAVFPEKSGQLC